MAEGKLNEKWTKEASAAANDVSAPIVVPGNITELSVILKPGGGGSAKVQYTTQDPATVVANPGAATWVDWDAGVVTAATARTLIGTVSCIRASATTQPATLYLAGQRWY